VQQKTKSGGFYVQGRETPKQAYDKLTYENDKLAYEKDKRATSADTPS
jgi:hypothetical protein